MSKDKNITGLTSLRFNSQNGVSVAGNKIDNADSSSQTNGLALPQVLDNAQRDKIVNSDDSKNPILFGTLAYNIATKKIEGTIERNDGKAAFINLGSDGGNVVGPNVSIADNIVTFSDISGKIIKDSGVSIARVPLELNLNQANNTPNSDRNILKNLGAIQFTERDGYIFVDDLTPILMQTQGAGAAARVCTVFSGDLPAGSSSPSAVLELNTKEGVLLLSRLNNAEENALDTVKSGSFWYNSETNKFRANQNGVNIDFAGSSTINPTGIITKDGVAVFNDASGTLLRSSTTTINSQGGITIGVSNYYNSIGGNGNVYEHNGTVYTITVPTLAIPDILSFTFPSNQPQLGYILTTDNNGNTTWAAKNSTLISNLTSSANSYTLQNDEHFIAVDTSTSSQEILLPISSTVSNGTRYLIKDAKGFAGINNITIKASGTDLIEGNTQISINTNYGFIEVINNQNNQWLII
jgi:hypothetical protein